MHRLCTGQAPRYVNRCPPVLEKPGGATRDGITHADQHAAPRPWGGVATLALRIHISLRMPTPPSAATARGRTAFGEAGHYLNHKAGYPLNHLLLNNPCRPSSPQGRVAGEWLNSGEGRGAHWGEWWSGRLPQRGIRVSRRGSPSLLSLLVSDGLFGGFKKYPGGEGLVPRIPFTALPSLAGVPRLSARPPVHGPLYADYVSPAAICLSMA